MRKTGHELVENMVVFLRGVQADHAGLVEEITVYLCTVEGATAHLYFDEMPLELDICHN